MLSFNRCPQHKNFTSISLDDETGGLRLTSSRDLLDRAHRLAGDAMTEKPPQPQCCPICGMFYSGVSCNTCKRDGKQRLQKVKR